MKAKIGNVVRRALLSGCVRPVGVAASAMIVTSLTGTAAGAATSASLDRRVSTLESEVRLLKNRAEALKAKGYEGVVRSGNSRVKVTLYGQVNRAVVIGFSRNNTEVHHVDNDTSESRLGFFARARISSDTVIEARFEVRWLENARSSIDDTNDGAAAATPTAPRNTRRK